MACFFVKIYRSRSFVRNHHAARSCQKVRQLVVAAAGTNDELCAQLLNLMIDNLKLG